MLGAIDLEPPSKEDDFINHSDTVIPQLDGNFSFDTLSLNQSNCNNSDISYETEVNTNQHTV